MKDLVTLAKEIERHKVDRTRELSMEERMLDGPRLFKLSCEAVKAGLRIDFPDAGEDEIHRRLIERVYGSR